MFHTFVCRSSLLTEYIFLFLQDILRAVTNWYMYPLFPPGPLSGGRENLRTPEKWPEWLPIQYIESHLSKLSRYWGQIYWPKLLWWRPGIRLLCCRYFYFVKGPPLYSYYSERGRCIDTKVAEIERWCSFISNFLFLWIQTWESQTKWNCRVPLSLQGYFCWQVHDFSSPLFV